MARAVKHPIHPTWNVLVTERGLYIRPGVKVLVHKPKPKHSRFWRRNRLDLTGFIRVHTKNIYGGD